MLILHTTDFRFQAFWFVTYSTGLRLSEALNLTISDIDRRRMTLHIRRAKGRKDRFVTMPRMTLAVLQKLWLSHRHASLLFPSNQPKKALQTLHRGTLQRTFRRVCLLCGIHKHVSIHSLRHSYATHLMEAGLNLQSLQIQLGHSEPQTTAKYVRLTEKSQHNSAELINRTIDQLVSALHGQKASS